mgnify:CR=1 FL=1
MRKLFSGISYFNMYNIVFFGVLLTGNITQALEELMKIRLISANESDNTSRATDLYYVITFVKYSLFLSKPAVAPI